MPAQKNTEDGNSYERYAIQLIREIVTRSGETPSKDEDFQNIIFEPVHDKTAKDQRDFIFKRCGTTPYISSQGAYEVRGMYYWETVGKLFYAINDHLIVYNLNTSTITDLGAQYSTTSGEVGFTEYLYDTNDIVLMSSDGQVLIRINTVDAVSVCADPDLPAPHLPNPVFVDGYLLLVKSGTADIYNSDLNDPMLWTPGNFISAEMSPDWVVKISKVNNYVVVFGTESVEYFWDAGNASGSPFSRNDSPIKINAYLGGLSQYGNDLYYVGKQDNGQASVFLLKDFKLDDVGTPSVMRYLGVETSNVSSWKTAMISVQGHNILLVNVGDLTFVYDTANKLWSRWAYQDTSNFPIVVSVRITGSNNRFTVFALEGSNSTIYKFNDSLMQDNGVNYTCKIITEQSNFGTMNRKTMPRVSLVGDRTPANSDILLSWSDDDYQTWSSNRTINLNQDLQSTYRLGSFRQRAFRLQYTGPYVMRLQKIEVDINKGIT